MKIIEIKGVDASFKIKAITAAESQKLLRKIYNLRKDCGFHGIS